MNMRLILKASGVWLIIMIAALSNGLVRDTLLVPLLGQQLALPVSGISLSVLVFLVTCLCVPYFDRNTASTFLYIGIQWVLMTLVFEFGFGHYVLGKSWHVLLQVFNVSRGDLFVLVLLTSLVSPYAAATVRGRLLAAIPFH